MDIKSKFLMKLSTCILCFTMIVSTFSLINFSDLMPTAYASTVKGTFSFSYLKGNCVDGLYNGKVYTLKKGEVVQLRVKSLSGATSDNKVTLQIRRRKTNGTLIVVFSKSIYKTGVYKCGTINTTNENYYLYAEGGEGTGSINKWISGGGNVECS